MDKEKLIEYVKTFPYLYDDSHPNYYNYLVKVNTWEEIADKMQSSALNCKQTWKTLKDSYRRYLKNRRDSESEQPASKIRKFKFMDELSFLLPFMQQATCSNWKDINDDNGENKSDEVEYDDKKDDDHDDKRDKRFDKNDENDDTSEEELYSDNTSEEESCLETVKKENREEINPTITQQTPKTQLKIAKERTQHNKEKYARKREILAKERYEKSIDAFFIGVAPTVKNLSPYYQNLAKKQISSIIFDLEEKHIKQSKPSEQGKRFVRHGLHKNITIKK
ncbi:nucleolar protein 12 [Solenopsis invicta]|uniref:nucleolar protein 12 n=1 Tax=Solenopsis invicta TaxID=13686 RepID=UPI0005958A31|nr:nucleolar protein 12 [Solenopsis invicta]